MGKSYIANYAAKYALYGRSDIDGALYINAEYTSSVASLIKLMFRRISENKVMQPIEQQSIESQVKQELANRKLVIIFDRMQKVINNEKKKLHPLILFQSLISAGKMSKFIAISNSKDDFEVIDPYFRPETLLIAELTTQQAARLLIYTTKDIESKINNNVNEKSLMKDEFFVKKQFELIPVLLINLLKKYELRELRNLRTSEVQKYLKDCSPEQNANNSSLLKRQDPRKQIEENESLQKAQSNESDQCSQKVLIDINRATPISEYDLTTDQNFSLLTQKLEVGKHQIEYQLFIMTCITPEGFSESDIDEICRVNKCSVEWRKFFEKVSGQLAQDEYFLEINCEIEKKEVAKEGLSQQSKSFPIFFDLKQKDDLISSHYLPTKIVCDHFYQNQLIIFRKNDIPDCFIMLMKYMAILARDVLKTTSQQKSKIPIDCICAASNQEIWKQEFDEEMQNQQDNNDDQQKKRIKKLQKYKDQRYYMHEQMVFDRMLYLGNLVQHFPNLAYPDELSKYICDFCISSISLMMLNENYFDAWDIIRNVYEPIASYYNFDLLKAKLTILKASLAILTDDSEVCETVLSELFDIEVILQQHYQNDPSAYADYYYLQAKLKIKLAYNLTDNHLEREQIEERVGHSNLQRTTSQIMEHSQPQTFQVEENKQGYSFSPTSTQQMMQMLGKSSSSGTDTSQVSGGKLINLVQLEKEIYQNLRQAKQNYCTNEGLANCHFSEAEFKMSKIGEKLYFRKLEDNIPEANQKEKILLQQSDPSQADLKKFEQYIDENAEALNIAKTLYSTMNRKDLEAKAHIFMGQLWTKKFDRYNREEEKKLDKVQLRSYIARAVLHLQKALDLYQQLKDQIEQKNVQDLIQKTQDRLCTLSDNLVIFASFFPLLDEDNKEKPSSSQQEEQFGPLTQYKYDFAENFKNLAWKRQIPIIMKQEILGQTKIAKIIQNKIKILHFQSLISHPTDLCIEDENARAKYIGDMLTEFSFQGHQNNFQRQNLRADLVVLAMPASKNQGQNFITLNVKYVVAFNFESVIKKFELNIMPMIYEYITRFCQSLYECILSREVSVIEAFQKAEVANKEGLENIITSFIKQEELQAKFNKKTINNQQLSQQLKSQIRPVLFPAKNAEGYIFGKLPRGNPIKSITTNSIIDSSLPLPLSNIDEYLKRETPYTGRKHLLQQIFENIQKPSVQIVEINGESGIGKTRLALEAADYLRKRYKFQKGIFYLDMEGVKTLEVLQQSVYQFDQLQFNNDKIDQNDTQSKQFCLIFDNLEDIAIDTEQLAYTFKSISKIYTFATLVVISKVKLFQYTNVYSLDVQSLNPNETIEFVNANCKLNLVDNLMEIIDNQQDYLGNAQLDLSSFKGYLLSHPAIKDLNGNPEFLLELCRIFESKGTTEYSKILEEFQELKQKYIALKQEQKQNMSIKRTSLLNSNRDSVPHNPEIRYPEEEKISIQSTLPLNQPILTHKAEDREREQMGYADVFGHLNQPHNMSGSHTDLNSEVLNQEEIDLQRALELSKREQ